MRYRFGTGTLPVLVIRREREKYEQRMMEFEIRETGEKSKESAGSGDKTAADTQAAF